LVLEGAAIVVDVAGAMLFGVESPGNIAAPTVQAAEWMESLFTSNKSLNSAQNEPGLTPTTFAGPPTDTQGGQIPFVPTTANPALLDFQAMSTLMRKVLNAAEQDSFLDAVHAFVSSAEDLGLLPTMFLNNDNLDFGPVAGEVFERIMSDGKVALSPLPHRTVLDPGFIPRHPGTHIGMEGNSSTVKSVHMVTRWSGADAAPTVTFVQKFSMKINDYIDSIIAAGFPLKPFMSLYEGDKTIHLYIELFPYDDAGTTLSSVWDFASGVSRTQYIQNASVLRLALDGSLVPYGPLDDSVTTFPAEWESITLTDEVTARYGFPRASFRFFTDFQNAITRAHPSGRTATAYRARFEVGMSVSGGADTDGGFTTVRTSSHLIASPVIPSDGLSSPLSFELNDGLINRAGSAMLWMFVPS